MSAFLELDLWQSLVPVLLHTLWIGAVAAIALTCVLRLLPASRNDLRYLVSLGALVIVVGGGLVAWGALTWEGEKEMESSTAEVETTDIVLKNEERPLQDSAPLQSESGGSVAIAFDWHSWLAFVWLIGVVFMLSRFFLALGAGSRLRRSIGPEGETIGLQQIVDRVSVQMGISVRVWIRVSERIMTPAVMGVFRPIILWPASWMTGLSEDQLVAVLSHELAHIRRHDYLVNLLQMLVEAMLFFNPAIWWISRQIRIEREACCDAEAAEVVGKRLDVARTLSLFAASDLDVAGLTPAAVALGKERFGVLERVKRLLDPGHRPSMRLPWPKLGLLVVAFALALRLAGTGAELAIAAVLDGEKHVAEVKKIEEDVSEPFGGGSYPMEQRVTVSVTVVTYDGQPVPKNADVNIRSTRSSYVSGHSADLQSDGTFLAEGVQPGVIQVSVSAKAYAPAVSKPITAGPRTSIDDLELELTKGFSMMLSVQDEAGQPVPDAPVSLAFSVNSKHAENREVKTNADGQVEVQRLIEGELAATIHLPGYQTLRKTAESRPDGLVSLVLRQSQPVEGEIVDKRTGQPVPGGHLRLIHEPGRGSHDPRTSSERKKLPFATADGEGRFAIDSLEQGKPYSFWFEAEGYRPEVIFGVRSGAKFMTVEMKPNIVVNATILGPLDSLPQGKDGQPELRYGQSLSTAEDSSYGGGGRVAVVVNDGVATAVFDEFVLEGRFSINTPSGIVYYPKAEEAGEIVVDLRPAGDSDKKTRKVIVRAVAPEGWPIPEGQLRVDYVPSGLNSYKRYELDLEMGQVEIDVPLDETGVTKFRYGPIKAPGFWIEEKSGIEIREGVEPELIEVKAYPGGTISGVVVDEYGNPIPSAGIGMNVIEAPEGMPRPDPNWWHGRAREDGRFVLSPVPMGGVYRPVAHDSRGGKVSRIFGEEIRIDKENPNPEVSLTIPRGKDVAIRVLDDQGAPLPYAKISWNYHAEHGGLSHSGMACDQDGRFVFRGVNFDIPVQYFVEVEPTEVLTGLQVDLTPETDDVELRLKLGNQLEGVVLDDRTGEPLIDRSIEARGVSSDIVYTDAIRTTTDGEGRFTFGNLESGQYRLSVEQTMPEGTVVTTLPDGRRQFSYPNRDTDGEDPSMVRVPLGPPVGPFELRVLPY